MANKFSVAVLLYVLLMDTAKTGVAMGSSVVKATKNDDYLIYNDKGFLSRNL